jgi:hypothetical protein
MTRRKTISYRSIPVVKNVRYGGNLKILVPSKFQKLLFSLGLMLIISFGIWIFTLIGGEVAAAGTIDINGLESLSYKIIKQDGSIAKLPTKFYNQELGEVEAGNIVSKFPIATKEEKLVWIEKLLEEEKENQVIEKNASKKHLISILGSKKRAELVINNAKKNGIPVYLVVGVIFAESSNKPSAISRVGARGLMQLMPDTAVIIARKSGMVKTALQIRKDHSFLNRNEKINISFGCTHLRDLYYKIGTWEGAVHAYNQGYSRYMKGYRSNKYVGNVFRYWKKFESEKE